MDSSRREAPTWREPPLAGGPAWLTWLEQWLLPAVPTLSDTWEPTPARSPLHEGLQVLVVDDNPAHQFVASELLGRMGATVLLAADGAQAVSLVCGSDIGLVLMDLQMPVLDGLGATRQIRRYELDHGDRHVPVVAYTSSAFAVDDGLLKDCGVDDVLDKPCSEQALYACVARWCRPAAGTGEWRAG